MLNLGGWSTIWVYADGRMISTDDRPADANGASSGLVEQRLTPDGVEFLRSAVISTGMFDEDLALAVGPGSRPTFLSVLVRNGDRLVNVTWAVRKNFLVGPDAPIATPEQASTLEGLYGLFTDPTSWPANAWEDREIRGYVPSTYSICFRAYPTPIEPVRAWGLLPRAAQDLLSAGDQVSEREVASNGNCSRVTTDDARALAEISNAAGIDIFDPPNGFPEVLQYRLYDPSAPLDEIDMNFAPILPDGHATWLGPG